MGEPAWRKRCECGATWTEVTWPKLDFVGTMNVPSMSAPATAPLFGDDEPPLSCLELRNCTCGSTLAIDVDEAGAAEAARAGTHPNESQTRRRYGQHAAVPTRRRLG